MKFKIHTLGCKVNIYESEFITHLFVSNGYTNVSDEGIADIYIINTCTVTNNADNKSRKLIRRAKKENKESIVIMCGCYSEYMKGNIEIDDVDIIIGNKDKNKLLETLEEYIKNKKQIIKISNIDNNNFEDMEINKFDSHTRAFVKIQDGCNNYCSYCIIPYVRGNVRSKNKQKVIDEITKLVGNGHKEVVLTGIHTGNYGKDLGCNLASLLEELVKIINLKRIRISSIEITELDEEFLNVLRNNKIIVDHMHIPLQSGSDTILKAMNRKYDTKYFYDKIKVIRSIRPNINITTDVIVGFPGEDFNEFNETMEFIRKVQFTKLHVFPYSKRTGTVAASMDNQVASEVKKIRAKTLNNISKELTKNYNSKFLNTITEVLIEKKIGGNRYVGHTNNFIEVIVESDLDISSNIIQVQINEIKNEKCYGKIMECEK